MTRLPKIGLALLTALVVGFSSGAQATSFNLGNISGPGVFSVGNSKAPGPFTDLIFFTIDPGVTLNFGAFVFNAFGRHGAIGDMDGTLSDASGVILMQMPSKTMIPVFRPRTARSPSQSRCWDQGTTT